MPVAVIAGVRQKIHFFCMDLQPRSRTRLPRHEVCADTADSAPLQIFTALPVDVEKQHHRVSRCERRHAARRKSRLASRVCSPT
jgi:hypothetical protein